MSKKLTYCFVCGHRTEVKTTQEGGDGRRCDDCLLRHKENNNKVGATKWETLANRWT